MLEVSLIALDYSLGCFEFPNGSWPARPGLPYKQLIGKLRTEEAGLHITPLGPTTLKSEDACLSPHASRHGLRFHSRPGSRRIKQGPGLLRQQRHGVIQSPASGTTRRVLLLAETHRVPLSIATRRGASMSGAGASPNLTFESPAAYAPARLRASY